MNYIKTRTHANVESANIFYKDTGEGKPVVFIHGWPMNSEMWDYQLAEFPKHNLRCISYDRRNFGKSTKSSVFYDYDTLASDLNEIIVQLNLFSVTLVGFSIGGGEIIRYISKYGTDRIEKVVLISLVTPFKHFNDEKTREVEKGKIDVLVQNVKADPNKFLAEFSKIFYGTNPVESTPIFDWDQMITSAKATSDCLHSLSETTFQDDLGKINIPILIIHGDGDVIVPIHVSANKTVSLINHAKYIVYSGAPHGLYFTEKQRLKTDIIDFIHAKH